MGIKFHEKAIAIFAVKQNSEGNPAVKVAADTTGTITTSNRASVVFEDLTVGQTIIFAGLTFTASGSIAKELVADAWKDLAVGTGFADANTQNPVAGGSFTAGTLTGYYTTDKDSDEVYFSPSVASLSDFTLTNSGTGSATVSYTKKVVIGTSTKFSYGAAPGDGLGEATVKAYLYDGTGGTELGQISSISSQTILTLVTDASQALSAADFSFGLGPKNCLAVLNLNYSTETASESHMYVGNELERDEYTVITDKWAKFDFETFVPKLGTIAGGDPTVDEIPYPHFFEAAGLAAVLSTGSAGYVQYTNELTSNALLTVEVRRSSQDDTSIQKVFTTSDVRGNIDLNSVVGTKGKIKWNFQGNLDSISDKPRFEPDAATLLTQKSLVAGSVKSTTIVTSQLSLYTSNDTVAPSYDQGLKNICFDKLNAPNFTGFEYNRYQTGCLDGWSKGAVPTDVTLTILEDKATATYNPDDNYERMHSLFLDYAPPATSAGVRFVFTKLQLSKINASKVANFSGQDLIFRNIGKVSIYLGTFGEAIVSDPVSFKPKFGVGGAILAADTAGLTTLLESMTDIPGSVDGGRAGSFTVTTDVGEYGWVAIAQTAYGSGLHFFDGVGYGGWSGAGLAGNNTGASPDPTVSTVTITRNGITWVFFRQDYVNANPSGGTYTIS
jgi:hypothetical protein